MSGCTVEGCDREASAKGLCTRHYMRLRRTGKLTTVRMTGDFWTKVKMGAPEECWPWQGYTKPSGHGLTSIKGLPTHASRKAWILTHGPIAEGLFVNHRCDNAICCNPDHLYLGTAIDNMIDHWEGTPAADRGRRNRRHVLSAAQIQELYEMRRKGVTLRACAAKFDCHIATICRVVTEWRRERLRKIRSDRLTSKSASQI